jgi:hypothetical protein
MQLLKVPVYAVHAIDREQQQSQAPQQQRAPSAPAAAVVVDRGLPAHWDRPSRHLMHKGVLYSRL